MSNLYPDDIAKRREHLMEFGKAFRCMVCGTDQIQLKAFDMKTSLWRCRLCKPYVEWDITNE